MVFSANIGDKNENNKSDGDIKSVIDMVNANLELGRRPNVGFHTFVRRIITNGISERNERKKINVKGKET